MNARKKTICKSVSVLLSVSIIVHVLSACSPNIFMKNVKAGFEDGWKAAIEYLGNSVAASESDDYISQVKDAIDAFEELINQSHGSERGIAQEAGFVAEKWTAATYNIDAALNESLYHAEAVGSNLLGSPDVTLFDDEGEEVLQASLKYYESGGKSAAAQATTILEAYQKYLGKTKSDNPLSFQAYCEKNGYDSDVDALYSIYEGQIRIIPEDQLDVAVDYLNGLIDLPDDQYAETLEKLRVRLEAPDGTKSKPATYEEMQAVAELAQNGDFSPEQFGFSITQIITPKYVVKQAIKGGLSSAAIETALSVGPDLFTVIRNSIRDGKLGLDQFKSSGIDGLFAASIGFVEGAMCSLLLSSCRLGILGKGLNDVSPHTVAALVTITKQAIRNGYSLANGDISGLEYGDMMAENVIVVSCSTASGIALQTLLPGLPFAYAIGSFVGQLLASVGYRIIKEAIKHVVLFISGVGGFEAMLPIDSNVENVCSLPGEKLSNVKKFLDKSTAKDVSIYYSKDGEVSVGLDGKFYCPNCDAVLDDMEGFDPDIDYFYCEECWMLLVDEDAYQGERFENITWFCDNCEACLSEQPGFTDLEDTWECLECGYVNQIAEDQILERFPGVIWYCEQCGDCLNEQYEFTDLACIWKCKKCGYKNEISEEKIEDVA